MITVTDEAATLIISLVNDSHLPPSGGLRLGTDPFFGFLAMSLRPKPETDDVIVQHQGALLFLAPAVAATLTEQILQAQLQDRPAFYLST